MRDSWSRPPSLEPRPVHSSGPSLPTTECSPTEERALPESHTGPESQSLPGVFGKLTTGFPRLSSGSGAPEMPAERDTSVGTYTAED